MTTSENATRSLFARANGMTAESFDEFLADDDDVVTPAAVPTGTYGNPGYGEPHPTAFGQAAGLTPSAEQVAAGHAEALEINSQIDVLAAEIDLRTARIRRALSDDLDFGDGTDVYEN